MTIATQPTVSQAVPVPHHTMHAAVSLSITHDECHMKSIDDAILRYLLSTL